MLGWMRKQTRSWFVYVAFGIIIIVFVFFYGYGGRGPGEKGVVALVNGQEISRRQYDKSYENLLMLSRDIYKKGFPEEEIKRLRRKALDDLIERVLVLQEAERWGLAASLEETRREIANTPAFQREGVFDKTLYLRQLAANRVGPGEFEKTVRVSMLTSKLVGVVQNTAKLSDEELFDLYKLENEKVNLRFVRLNVLDFEGKADISEEEVGTYYENAREDFRVPPRVRVRYLSFDPRLYREKAAIAPEEIERVYRVNADRFLQRKKVRARHILVEVKGRGGGATEEEARKKAEEIKGRIEKGEDFSQLAKQFSQDAATASKGGDLGYFERGQMVEAFDEVAFSLRPGEVGPVVKTPQGFDIIKVEDVQEGGPKPLGEVRSAIEEELKVERSDGLAKGGAQRAVSQIYRGSDLISYAEKNGLKVFETDFFSEGEPIEGIGTNRSFGDAAFLLKKGETSPIISVGKKYLVLQLAERKEPYLPNLEEVQERVVKLVRREKAGAMTKKKAEQLLKELASGSPMDQIASREHLTIEETGFFTSRSGFISKVGSSKELAKEAFSLTSQKPFPRKAYSIGNSFFVFGLKEREEAELEKFQSEKERVQAGLLVQKGEERIKAWLAGLKKKAKIEVLITI